MRMNGGYSLHQSLTTETAAVVKQAIGLARRRGHAQVTPLHVAIAMLSWSGSFKRACLQSRSHPLQSKALDLCFNVALNRLPTSSSSPLLGLHSHLPSLSNALVAAFKRAQAHQRRGSTEHGQQQPVLALKVEVHQLVISILYDPSVSRVMREAGFSSAHVRNNVEQSEKRDVSINSTDAVSSPQKNKNLPSLSQFRFPPLLRQQKMINHSENTNLALSLSLKNSCVDDMHGEAVDNCKWLTFHEKAAEMKKEKEEKLRLRSSAKLPPWLQQYKDESATQINVFNELQVSRKPDLVSNPNSSPNSASSSEDDNYTKLNNNNNKFKEIDSDYTDMGKKDDQEEEGNSDEMKKCGLLDLNMATEEEEDDDDENSVCKEIGILDLVDQQNRIRNPGLTINVN